MTAGIASSIEENVCVAPNSIAFSRLNSTGSTAITRVAPAIARALHGVDADAADADHDDGVAGLHAGPA